VGIQYAACVVNFEVLKKLLDSSSSSR